MATTARQPAEMPKGVEEQTKLLQELATIPNISRASCLPVGDKGVAITVQLSQRDLPANSSRKFNKQVLVLDTRRPDPITLPTIIPDFKDASLVSVSPSGQRTLVGKGGGDNAGGAVLEIWAGSRLLLELVVPASLHGNLYNDGWFGHGAAWSADESRVVYVAEVPVAEKTPQWGGSDAKDSAAPKGWRGKAAWEEDWGELNTGKRAPSLYSLDIPTASVAEVEHGLKECSVGQPLFAPSTGGLVFVAWPHAACNFPAAAKRLGVVYCFNRPCALYYLPELTGANATRLTPDDSSAFMPLFTPDGAQLLFLSAAAAVQSGVHNATNSLLSLPWPQAAGDGQVLARVLVPVVQTAEGSDEFPGLYCASLLERPFLDDHTLLLTSAWRSTQAILAVDVSSGKVTRVTPAEPAATWSLLAVERSLLVASCSSPSSPPQLMLGSSEGSSSGWTWQEVGGVSSADSLPAAAAAALADVQYEILEIAPTVGDLDIKFEALVIRPKSAAGRTLPTIITPHGGPHSAYSANYYMPYLPLLAMGFVVVAVNYRGSTGFGEASVQSLPGRIGVNDVADCIAALDACVEKGITDPARVAVMGGSHGGFVTGHLVAQQPHRFRCGVLRNPVLNLSLMVGLTDILDWCYIEGLGTKEGRSRVTPLPGPQDLQRLFEASPAAHLDKVTAPLLLMLGAKDRRVPLQDGLQYAAGLKARGVAHRVVVFPEDTHALDKPQTEFEQWANIAWWLKEYVPMGQTS